MSFRLPLAVLNLSLGRKCDPSRKFGLNLRMPKLGISSAPALFDFFM